MITSPKWPILIIQLSLDIISEDLFDKQIKSKALLGHLAAWGVRMQLEVVLKVDINQIPYWCRIFFTLIIKQLNFFKMLWSNVVKLMPALLYIFAVLSVRIIQYHVLLLRARWFLLNPQVKETLFRGMWQLLMPNFPPWLTYQRPLPLRQGVVRDQLPLPSLCRLPLTRTSPSWVHGRISGRASSVNVSCNEAVLSYIQSTIHYIELWGIKLPHQLLSVYVSAIYQREGFHHFRGGKLQSYSGMHIM